MFPSFQFREKEPPETDVPSHNVHTQHVLAGFPDGISAHTVAYCSMTRGGGGRWGMKPFGQAVTQCIAETDSTCAALGSLCWDCITHCSVTLDVNGKMGLTTIYETVIGNKWISWFQVYRISPSTQWYVGERERENENLDLPYPTPILSIHGNFSSQQLRQYSSH